MTLSLTSFSEVSSGGGAAPFLERFAEAAPLIRSEAFAPWAPSAAYTTMVLNMLRRRPFEAFLVMDGGQVRGRIAVGELGAKPDDAGAGLFEVATGEDELRTSRMLISAAMEWAARGGYSGIYAPIDASTWFSYRFLVPQSDDAPHTRLFSWEPVQAPAYLDAFIREGFAELETYQTVVMHFDAASAHSLSNVADLSSSAVSSAESAGHVFERLSDHQQLPAVLDEAFDLCMSAFAGNLLFEPVSRDLFRTILLSAAAIRDCTSSHWVRDAAGQMRGFLFAFVDGDATVVKTIAISPDSRGHRLSTALVHLAAKEAAARGLVTFVSALVRTGNRSASLSDSLAEHCGWKETHEYMLLRRDVPPVGGRAEA